MLATRGGRSRRPNLRRRDPVAFLAQLRTKKDQAVKPMSCGQYLWEAKRTWILHKDSSKAYNMIPM